MESHEVNEETLQRPFRLVVGFTSQTSGVRGDTTETRHQKVATPINQAGSTLQDTCQRAGCSLWREPWIRAGQGRYLDRH